jgi:hypothetical protein
MYIFVPGVITGPPRHWGTGIQTPGSPTCGLGAKLTTFLCKNLLIRNPKKRKPDGVLKEKSGRIF